MAEKKRRLIDDLLQDDFFGIREEKKEEEKIEESVDFFEDVEETSERETGESTVDAGTLFEEELIEEETEETSIKAGEEEIEEIKGETTPEEVPQKKKSGILILILILLLIAGGGGTAYFLFLKGKTPFSKPAGKESVPVKKKVTAKKPSESKKVKKITRVATPVTVVTKKKQPEEAVSRQSSEQPVKQKKTVQKKETEEKVAKLTPATKPQQPVKPTIQIPRYSVKAGPFNSKDLAMRWMQSLSAQGFEVKIFTLSVPSTLFYINAGTMDKPRAEALKLKIKIFMPDQAGKIIFQEKGNSVTFLLGPYKDANAANGVIARLQTPKLNVQGKLITRTSNVETYYLKIGKFPTRKEALDTAAKLKKMGLNAEVTGL